MTTFKSLPEAVYRVRSKNPEKFQAWLHTYGCNLVVQPCDAGKDFYIMTNHYGYFIESWSELPYDALTPKQFKRLVREAVGEPE